MQRWHGRIIERQLQKQLEGEKLDYLVYEQWKKNTIEPIQTEDAIRQSRLGKCIQKHNCNNVYIWNTVGLENKNDIERQWVDALYRLESELVSWKDICELEEIVSADKRILQYLRRVLERLEFIIYQARQQELSKVLDIYNKCKIKNVSTMLLGILYRTQTDFSIPDFTIFECYIRKYC